MAFALIFMSFSSFFSVFWVVLRPFLHGICFGFEVVLLFIFTVFLGLFCAAFCVNFGAISNWFSCFFVLVLWLFLLRFRHEFCLISSCFSWLLALFVGLFLAFFIEGT